MIKIENKWVFFYTLVIVALVFFAMVVGGLVNINFSLFGFIKPSPDLTVTKLQALCAVNKYDAIVLRSLKFEEGKYSRITEGDIVAGSKDVLIDYPAQAKALCGWIKSSRKVEKIKVSDTGWNYKYYTDILFESSHAYGIRYFDSDWRF